MSSSAFNQRAKRAEEARTERSQEQDQAERIARQEIRFHEERGFLRRVGVTRLILVNAGVGRPGNGRVFLEARSTRVSGEILITFGGFAGICAGILFGRIFGSFAAGVWCALTGFLVTAGILALVSRPRILRLETTLQEWMDPRSAVSPVREHVYSDRLLSGGQDRTALSIRNAMRRLDRTVELKGRSTLMELKIDSPELSQARDGRFDVSQARELVYLFDPMINGNLSGMFEDEGSIRFNPTSPYTVFDTYAMEKRGDLALAITQTITNSWVQNTVSNKSAGRRYMVIREEGWRDMKTLQALEAHELQLKLSGEFGITMVMIVHEDGDFDTGGEQERQLAQKLLRGYANTITFYQNQNTLKRAVATGTMTQGEADVVRGFDRGEFLLKAGERSYVINSRPTSTEWERSLFDTDNAMRHRDEEHQNAIQKEAA
ncbi:hypothetical protein D3248_01675 [Leucobacter zeae]|nr:hypothetical protein [Leucobacter zeae]